MRPDAAPTARRPQRLAGLDWHDGTIQHAVRATERQGLDCDCEVDSPGVDGLVTHRFRAGLTMLGISWGIVTVVVLLAYGQGFHRRAPARVPECLLAGHRRHLGGQTSTQAGGERAGRRIWLKDGDVEALRELGSLKYVSPEFLESMQIGYGTRQTTAGVRGVSPEYAVMRTRPRRSAVHQCGGRGVTAPRGVPRHRGARGCSRTSRRWRDHRDPRPRLRGGRRPRRQGSDLELLLSGQAVGVQSRHTVVRQICTRTTWTTSSSRR